MGEVRGVPASTFLYKQLLTDRFNCECSSPANWAPHEGALVGYIYQCLPLPLQSYSFHYSKNIWLIYIYIYIYNGPKCFYNIDFRSKSNNTIFFLCTSACSLGYNIDFIIIGSQSLSKNATSGKKVQVTRKEYIELKLWSTRKETHLKIF